MTVVGAIASLALLVLAGSPGGVHAPAGDPSKRAALAAVGLEGDPVGRPTGGAGLPEKNALLELQRRAAAGPGAAESLYMGTTRPITVKREACRFARRAARSASLRDDLVVLDFGRPRKKRGNLGTSLFGSGFRSTAQIAGAAEAYVRGFTSCLGRSATHLVLAIGTSNFGGQVTFDQGRAWATMVNRVADWVSGNGYAARVAVAGANDIELGWNGPAVSRRWVRGYDSVAEHPYLDYGDAAGCPPNGDCIGRWTVEDVWFVSWGARWALPLPEIYAPNGSSARQWQRLSLYSQRRHGRPMVIAGAMSQRRACRQSSDPCRGMDNSPGRAWRLLWRALNRDRRTAQPVRWSTDVKWGK